MTTKSNSIVYIDDEEYLKNPWWFNNKPFNIDDIGKNVGFVYLITDQTTGKKYIGRKYFTHSRKGKGRKRIKFDSDWKEYYSSSEELKKLVEEKGKQNFRREIVCLGKTRGEINFGEVLAQVLAGVLESDEWMNGAINKWKKKNVIRYESLVEIRHFFTTTS